MSKPPSFEIIAGTYEEYTLGYIFSRKGKTLTQSFASHDHSSSIKCLATSGHYLASGGSDDRIIVYDLKTRKQHCMLSHHNSTITALTFTNNHSHLLSASQDGALTVVRVGNWQVEKLWEKAHKEGHVLDIAVHPSGKLALTLGSDSTLHTWNLVKGREAYIINLKTKCRDPKSIEKLLFAPDGVTFVLFGGKFTEIWSIETGGVIQAIEHEQRVTCCLWLDHDNIFVGHEDGHLSITNLESKHKTIKLGHDGRVKAAQFFQGNIVTASSAGEIKVWNRKLKERCKVSTGCRITCVQLAKWIGTLKKEEEGETEVVEQEIPVRPPRKGRIIVEIEGSSSEDEPKRKRKKLKNV